MKIESNYSLKELNSFKLKSSAQYFCDVKDIDEAHEAIDFAKKEDFGCKRKFLLNQKVLQI